MDYKKLYQKKKRTAQEAVKIVKSGDWIDYGWCVTTPISLDRELAKRMPELENINFSGGILMWEPEIFKIKNPKEHFVWNSWHMSRPERKAVSKGFSYYAPVRYSELPRYYRDGACRPDIAMFQVAPMDEFGYFNFGPSVSHMKAVCDVSKTIIVEVNNNIPKTLGGIEESVHISQVDFIVEGDNPPLAQSADADTTEVDEEVAKLIVEEIPNGACLQLGIGGMPNAVGSLIARSDLKDLGVHTEMYVNSFVDIAEAGKINGSKKNVDRYRQTFAFAAGTQKLYDYINGNPETMGTTVEYTNDVRVISSIDNFISINNAVNLDLYGQINAESAGTKPISGAGGQLDFVLGAYLSKGGKSFICCSSTYKDKEGNIKSRILPTLDKGSIVTDTRATTQYLVTEYGKVNLKGLSTWQRCEAIISIAHPDFREELIKQADSMKIWRKSNKRNL